MGDKDGKQVLMCSWGRKSDPSLGMDFTTKHTETKVVGEDKTHASVGGMLVIGRCGWVICFRKS